MKIKFENVCYHYNTKLPQKKQALKNISLEISDGEFVGLIGPSGSGKTTLLQHFTGLLRPTSGTIYVDGQDIGIHNYPLRELRKKIGLVFQFPETQLFEETVYSDISFGPRTLRLANDEIDLRVDQVLKLVGMIDETIKTRSPQQLSEGEKRRVAIAGVLAMAPDMLVLDEPTACLDPSGVKLIIQILKQLHENKTTIVIITHNMDVIVQLVQRIIILNNGEICLDGSKEYIFRNEELLNSLNLEVPRIIRLGQFLNRKKIISQPGIYSVADLKTEIQKSQTVERQFGKGE